MDPQRPPRDNEHHPLKTTSALVNTGHSREVPYEEFSKAENPPIKYVFASFAAKSERLEDAMKNTKMEYFLKADDDEDE